MAIDNPNQKLAILSYMAQNPILKVPSGPFLILES